jgi:hypothetical protein
MTYAVEMGLGAMIHTPSFIKIGSDIQNLIGGATQTHRHHGHRTSLIVFFSNIRKVGKNKQRKSVYCWYKV